MDDDSPGPPVPNIGANRVADKKDPQKEIERLQLEMQALKAQLGNQQTPNQPNLPETKMQHHGIPEQYNNSPYLQVFLLSHKLTLLKTLM